MNSSVPTKEASGEISFSQETKNHLCSINYKKQCCKVALLYGILILSNTFTREKIRLITENERLSTLTIRLLKSCFSVEGNLYISQKSLGGQKFNSYKITVSNKEDLGKIFSGFGYEAGEEIEEIKDGLFLCEGCLPAFIRGAFLTGGTISDPQKTSGYHLEISSPNEQLLNKVHEKMLEAGLSPKFGMRKSSHSQNKKYPVIYFKESEAIEDFLTYIGAPQAALNIMNVKIYKDIRNNENRRSNCDTANIYKMTEAAQAQIKAINYFRTENGEFARLTPDLETTARLRLMYPTASLQELGDLHEPKITKSGVNHRLKKIMELATREQSKSAVLKKKKAK